LDLQPCSSRWAFIDIYIRLQVFMININSQNIAHGFYLYIAELELFLTWVRIYLSHNGTRTLLSTRTSDRNRVLLTRVQIGLCRTRLKLGLWVLCESFVNTLPQDQRGRLHVELETQLWEPSWDKWFSKCISNPIRARNKLNNQGLICNTILDKVKIYFHMLGTCMEHQIDWHVGSTK